MLMWGAVLLASTMGAATRDQRTIPPPVPPLEHGFHLLYALDFSGANGEFQHWQHLHPEDPVGPVCEAAGLLFSEFHRLGVLESQFLTTDDSFLHRKRLRADEAVRKQFEAALDRAEAKGNQQVKANPQDKNALFALTLASGLRADYAALIAKQNFASLRYTKQSTIWAQQLLAVDPQNYDAYVATGFSKYITGTLILPMRWLLRMGGIESDKQGGLADLELTASKGHYLAPFARILLAIAYVREKDKPRARQLLQELREEFPSNPLFAMEIARLDKTP